jgi:RDD family
VEGSSFSFELTGAEAALYIALVLVYYFALEAAIGQTVGKLLLGLRVVRTDGTRPSLVAVAVRSLVRVVDWLPFLYLVGFIAMLATGKRRQRLGDLAARTSVGQAAPVRRRGLAAAAVALVVLGLFGFSFYRATVSEGVSASPDGLSDLRVCRDEAYDEGEGECTDDQREQPLSGRAVYCSAKVGGREGERFTGRLLYEGELFFTGGRTLAGEGTVWVNVDLGESLPGGDWSCELSVGSDTVSARFQGTGPARKIAGLAACPTANTVLAGSVRVCREDESGAPLSSIDSVTCSTTVFGGTGEVIRVDFLYEGRETGLTVRRQILGPLEEFEAYLTRQPSLLAGDYTCRFFLAGEHVGEKQFSIAG